VSDVLTRRETLKLGAAASASALVPGAAALAAPAFAAAPAPARPPRLVSLAVALPGARAAGAAWWTGRAVEVPGSFDLLGLTWDAGDAHAQVRVRRGRRWGRWVELGHAHAHAEDGRARRPGAEPAWFGDADAFQVRLSRRVSGLEAHAVDTRPGGGGAGVRARARAASRPQQQAPVPGAPPMVLRETWDGGRVPPRDAPTMGQVQVGFVHHTVTENAYGPEESAEMVLGIARYHRDVNGWDDIGYNFLVDRHGQVFEGRAGGVDQPVVGAQAQGFNAVSTGVAILGTFTGEPAPEPAIDAVVRVLAWKLPLHGVPVTGTVEVTSAGGSASRYGRGQRVTLQRISGHRDTGETACPGEQLYAQLGAIRARAAGQAGPIAAPTARLSVAAVATQVTYPEPVRLSGRFEPATGGRRVSLQVASNGRWVTVGRTVTAADGSFTGEIRTARSRRVRAVSGAAASPSLAVAVRPSLRSRVSTRRLRAGSAVRVTGTVAPRSGPVAVVVELRGRDGAYRPVGLARGRARDGRFALRIPLRRAGLYRLTTRAGGGREQLEARTAPVLVRAVRRR